MGWRRACPRSSSSRSGSRIPSPTARMAAAARDRARPSGSSAITIRTTPFRASIGGARRARTISSCASANGKRRIRCGCGSISRRRCGSVRLCPRPPRRAAAWCSRLRLPSFSPVAASASACLAVGPLPAALPRAASPRCCWATPARRACRPTRSSAASPNASCSAISWSLWAPPPIVWRRSRRRACAAISSRCSIRPRRRCLTLGVPSLPRAKAGIA